MRASVITLSAGLVLAGCELNEVTVPRGEPTLVVQSVIRTDLAAQFVFVERSLTGDMATLDPITDGVPVTNATVVLTNLSNPINSGCLRQVVLSPNEGLAGRYDSPVDCLDVQPGDTLSLLVTTPDGFRVTGMMRAPGMVDMRMFINRQLVMADSRDVLAFDRETDSLRFVVRPRFGRALDINIESITGIGIVGNRFSFFLDDTTLTIPGDLLDPLELDIDEPGQPLFRAGRTTQVSVSLSDSNYYDWVRSGNDPFTGQGFINRLEGGIGVFGGLDTRTFTYRVTAEQEDEREGRYRLTGTLDDQGTPVAVDAVMDVYLTSAGSGVENPTFSAFLDGVWAGQGRSGSIDGRFRGNSMDAEFALAGADVFLLQAADVTLPTFEIQVVSTSGAVRTIQARRDPGR